MINLKFTFYCTLSLLLFFIGCGEPLHKVTGTVKYDDGSPVTLGNVSFDSDKFSFSSTIDANGYFSSPGQKSKGIPEGTYRVYLTGTTKVPNIPDARGTFTQGTPEPTVAEKYCSAATASLTFEAKPGGTKTFDIVVERPKKR
ncbi:MAG: hypothetical protein LBK82_17605 [Planctomycetaceae bacterium]|jgi:hypothetical protein|nr:hypothetical protein [Planctomycetaceae bacterium]